jgi:hypothetical protein
MLANPSLQIFLSLGLLHKSVRIKIFIITISKTAPFWAIAVRRNICGVWPGFHLFGFRKSFFYGTSLSALRPTPQPGDPGPRLYIPQEQGGPVIPPDTGFPFRRLLRLAEPRWRYSNPTPHGKRIKIYITLVFCLLFIMGVELGLSH